MACVSRGKVEHLYVEWRRPPVPLLDAATKLRGPDHPEGDGSVNQSIGAPGDETREARTVPALLFDGLMHVEEIRHCEYQERYAATLALRDAQGRLLYSVSSSGNLHRSRKVTPKRKQFVLDRDGHRCVTCGSDSPIEIDHIVPYRAGGGNEVENLQTLCRPCHVSKGKAT